MRTAQWILVSAVAFGSAASSASATDGLGLTPHADGMPWSRWQGRISLGTAPPVWRSGFDGFETSGLKPTGFRLMGDYYFTQATDPASTVGGFRASSGVVVGPRSLWWVSQPGTAAPTGGDTDATPKGTWPYVGVGYSGLAPRSGWSFSADLGVLAPGVADGRWDERRGDASPLVASPRDKRLAPVLQLGVSRSF